MTGTLSTDQAAAHVGITFRQLDHWARNGWVTPSEARSNHAKVASYRGWTPDDMRVVKVVHLLRTKAPRRRFDWPRIARLVAAHPAGWLIFDGTRIDVAETPVGALFLLEGAACAICVAIPDRGDPANG